MFKILILHTENLIILLSLVGKHQCQRLAKYATQLSDLAHQTEFNDSSLVTVQRDKHVSVCFYFSLAADLLYIRSLYMCFYLCACPSRSGFYLAHRTVNFMVSILFAEYHERL